MAEDGRAGDVPKGGVPADWQALNRASWDEHVPRSIASGSYDVASLWDGRRRFDPIMEAELPRLQGRRVLHLQCHFGLDTLTMAQRGADVTGLDFSTAAIREARRLTDEGRLKARFVRCDLYDAPGALGEPASFDLVVATWGTIGWLPDVAAWAKVVRAFLKPGGALYFADIHPVAQVVDDAAGPDGTPRWHTPYFGRQMMAGDGAFDDASGQAPSGGSRRVTWLHPLGDILEALQQAGLRLDWLHEHAGLPRCMIRNLKRGDDGMWTWPERPWLPLGLSLRAVKP